MIEKLPLNALKCFYYVATHDSVTVASEKLFVTQSAVSKQLKNLEANLDMALFDRVGKSMVLTSNGERLFACCQKMFSELDECLLDLKQHQTNQKQLVLSCEPTMSMKWLIPRLESFNQLNYGFEIVLLTGGGAVDFKSKSIDLALRRNDFEWGNDIFHEKMVDEYIVAVRKPNNFDKSGEKNGGHSDKQTLLVTSSRADLWQNLHQSRLFKTGVFNQELLAFEKMTLEHFYLCIEASVAGLGTAVASIFMVEKELSHQLLELVHPPVADSSAYHLLSYTPFHEDPRKVLFKDWLKQEMEKSKQDFLATYS